MTRSASIDAVRVVLCASVVAFHGAAEACFYAGRPFGACAWHRVLAWLAISGVPCFFALTGYHVMLHPPVSFPTFVTRRWRRLYPLVLTGTLLAASVGRSFRSVDGFLANDALAWLGMYATLVPSASAWNNSTCKHLWSCLVDFHAAAFLFAVRDAVAKRPTLAIAAALALQLAISLHQDCVWNDPYPLPDAFDYVGDAAASFIYRRSARSLPSPVDACAHLTTEQHVYLHTFYAYAFSPARLTPFFVGAYFAATRGAPRSSAASVTLGICYAAASIAACVAEPDRDAPAWARLLAAALNDVLPPVVVMRVALAFAGLRSKTISRAAAATPWVYAVHLPLLHAVL